LFVGSPETTAEKVTGVATGAGDDTEAETATVIPFAAVSPTNAKHTTVTRQLRIPCIFLCTIEELRREGTSVPVILATEPF
jgi:hypothetical protein